MRNINRLVVAGVFSDQCFRVISIEVESINDEQKIFISQSLAEIMEDSVLNFELFLRNFRY